MLVDLPLTALRGYRPEVAEPPDFDEFWADQMGRARERGVPATFTRIDSPLTHADVYDVTFSGYGGDPIRAWSLVPRRMVPDAAMVVEYVGYNGGRGHPVDWLTWSAAGYPYLVMDSRGQGGGWRLGDTADPSDNGAPSANGFLTRGIEDPRTYYMVRLFVDAARAVDAARSHPAVGSRRLVTTGASQGGALAIAAAHLAGGVGAVLPDVPFLAHPRRALEVTDTKPYGELIEYCATRPDRVDLVFSTISYVDAVNHAKRVDAPALFSVGLIDEITPASTVFAAYNHYAGPKDIAVYPFNGHEGGGARQVLAKFGFVARQLSVDG